MNTRQYLFLVFCWMAAISCSDDSPAPSSAFSNYPEASSTEDAKSGGIYKGVIAGSTGKVVVVLQKGAKEIRLTMDGESRTLTTTMLSTWTSGSLIKNAV